MSIRDRIRELRRIPAAELLPNPRNWRTHPRRQREALEALLAEIGYADALLAREMPDGRLMLIDGHLRAQTTPQTTVPVLVLDLNDDEADKLLATLDPLAAQAQADSQKLAELLGTLKFESAALREVLAELVPPSLPDPESEPESRPLCQQYNIIITCVDEQQQVDLLERFTAEGLSCRALIV
ncbi:MAG: hypothetical protein EXS05_18085 [Planctomycetaceae bacterium]|nr:hypothetical protein [Planctomycetaceae bacterium]